MPRFSDRFLDDLRLAISVLEYAKRVGKVEKSGSEWRLADNHSVKIDARKNIWGDFGSGNNAGGDVIALERHLSGCSFEDAVEKIAGMIGLKMPENSPRQATPPRNGNGADVVPPDPPDHPGPGTNGATPHSSPAGGRTITAAYDYVDADGGLVYQTCRIEWIDDGKKKKSFGQRRRAPDGAWAWGLSEGVYLKSRFNGEWYQATADRLGKWLNAPATDLEGVAHRLYNFDALREEMAQDESERRTIFICYTGDTEVLTENGWARFDAVDPQAPVAQWEMSDGRISFARPTAHQRFDYSGEMIHIAADWCDLIVTPDHRQPSTYSDLKRRRTPKVRPASALRYGHQLPVSGFMQETDRGPTVEIARLLVAWLGDGVREPRGNQVSWNLKKERKKTRLRDLLRACNIAWTEHEYPSTPGWINIRVTKVAMADVLLLSGDGKRWPWEILSWSQNAREAMLEEAAFWDGDHSGKIGRRFFTSERQSADVLSALAVVSGWSVTLRIDRRKDRNDSFVVNYGPRTWRMLGKTPTKVDYAGKVYCCTVPTSFLVVRRNGKVIISGNCEGEKDADNMSSWGLMTTTNSGGAKHWLPWMAEEFRGADVVLVLDNDKAGRERETKLGIALRPIVRSLRALWWPDHWPGCPDKGDVTDWIEKGEGTLDKFFAIIDKLDPWSPKMPDSAFGAMRYIDIDRPGRELAWLVKGVLTAGEVSIWYGAWGSGKSFLITDCAMAVARGNRWMGNKTLQGLVMYQAGEGALGLRKRLRAYRQHHKLPSNDDIPFVLLPARIDIFANDIDMNKLIAELLGWKAFYDHPLRLLVLDTLNAAAPGADENTSRDIGPVLNRARKIAEATGAHVALVDHTPKDGGSPRGWSGKMGNVDNGIAVTRTEKFDRQLNEDGTRFYDREVREWTVAKQKDEQDRKSMQFILKRVVLGKDEEGDEISSCIVEAIGKVDSTAPAGSKRDECPPGYHKMNPANEDVMRCLVRAIKRHGKTAPPGIDAPTGEPVITVGEWQAELIELQVGHEEITTTLRERIKKRVQRACRYWDCDQGHAGLIVKQNEYVWRTGRKVHMVDAPPPRAAKETQTVMALAPGETDDDIGSYLEKG